jgi:hypothetical protein
VDLYHKYGIPEKPPDDLPMRDELMWFMVRESYRIAKEREAVGRQAKIIGKMILWIMGTIAVVVAFWDWLRQLAR